MKTFIENLEKKLKENINILKIEAHRKIMKVLSTEMKSQIHALQIKIE